MNRRLCVVEGCNKAATATVYCQMHYRRFRLYGDPNKFINKQRRACEASQITICGNHAEVELTQDKVALIDLVDVERIKEFNWYFSSSTGYAYSAKAGTSMQQFLIGKAPEGYEIDHGNRNKLDNRRDNIKHKTETDNCYNTERSDKKKSVAFHKASGKYQAYIGLGKYAQIYLGLFLTETEALKAQKKANALFVECNFDLVLFKPAWKLMRGRKADTEKKDE